MITVFGGERCPEINEGIASFVASHIPGCERGFTNFTTMGVVEGDRLIAGVVFHNWNPESAVIELSAAALSKRWLNRSVLTSLFSYPFDQLACQMVILRVAEQNKSMCRIAQAYGFTPYRIPRLRGRDEAEIVFTLTDDAWRSSRFHKRQVRNG
ncbi:GNAT family protein [Xylophilus sp.]|uniref:GNAT family protein n=1 Tax=Xylophilus sp. TaxID=2653893 RepID=UPI002D801EBA|nr:GNAT family protein [Xylophilus sp.]